MNDYLTAVAAIEMTRSPRPTWTHRPYPRRRRRALVPRIAARVRLVPQRQPAPALS